MCKNSQGRSIEKLGLILRIKQLREDAIACVAVIIQIREELLWLTVPASPLRHLDYSTCCFLSELMGGSAE